eukprot:TRINITY_DN8589_c0_g1_i1.p1 TRINITY_DN8589_c0_g1~~TRINITY_DN8589_c0_g1_i1.p1  ORF type:complete len:976 (+),score=160.54 TRINITY_DN8589_c0_g1_i1:80-3007(+)
MSRAMQYEGLPSSLGANDLNLEDARVSTEDPQWRMFSIWGDGKSELDLSDFVMAEVVRGNVGDKRRQSTILFGLSAAETPELTPSQVFKRPWPGAGLVGLQVHNMGDVVGFENGDPFDRNLIKHTYVSKGQKPGDRFQIAYTNGQLLLLHNNKLLSKRKVDFAGKTFFHLYTQDGGKSSCVVTVRKYMRRDFCFCCAGLYTLNLRLRASMLRQRSATKEESSCTAAKVLQPFAPQAAAATSQGHSNWILGICWLPGMKYFATSSRDGTLKVWCVESGSCVITLKPEQVPEGPSQDSLFYSPIALWDTKVSPGIQCVLAAGRNDGYLDFWTVHSVALINSDPGKCFQLVGRAFHAAKREGQSLDFGVCTLVTDSTYHRSFSAGNGKVCAWDLLHGSIAHPPSTRARDRAPSLSLMLQEDKGESPVLKTPRVKEEVAAEAFWTREMDVQSLAVANDGVLLVACMRDEKAVKIMDARTGEERRTVNFSESATAAALIPNGLIVGFVKGTVSVYHDIDALIDDPTAKADLTCTGHVGKIWRILPLQLHSEGLYMATCSGDGHTRVYRIARTLPKGDAPCFANFRGHTSAVTSAIFQGEFRRMRTEADVNLQEEQSLFTASFDGTVKRWSVRPGENRNSADPGDLVPRQLFKNTTIVEVLVAPMSWLYSLFLLCSIQWSTSHTGPGALVTRFINLCGTFWTAYTIAAVLGWSVVVFLASDAHARLMEWADEEEKECDPGLSLWLPHAERVGKMLFFVSQVIWVPLFGALISVHDCKFSREGSSEKVLEVDPSIICYEGTHLVVVSQSFVLVFCYMFLSAPLLINLGDASYLAPLRGGFCSRFLQRMNPRTWWGGGVRYRRPMYSGELTRRRGYYVFETVLVFLKIFVPVIKQFTTYSGQLQHVCHYLVDLVLFYAIVKRSPLRGRVMETVLECAVFFMSLVPLVQVINLSLTEEEFMRQFHAQVDTVDRIANRTHHFLQE